MYESGTHHSKQSISWPTETEKLRFFTNEVYAELLKLGIKPALNFKIRSNVLEVFLDEAGLTTSALQHPDDEASLYIRAGIFLSRFKHFAKKQGCRAFIRTWPRFDEANLLAFVYLSAKEEPACPEPTPSPRRTTGCTETLLHKIRQLAQEKKCTIATARAAYLVSPPAFTATATATLKQKEPADPVAQTLFSLSAHRNTPPAWVGLGLLAGETIQLCAQHNFRLTPLCTGSCPEQPKDGIQN